MDDRGWTERSPRGGRGQGSPFGSPAVAAGLALVVVLLVGAIVLVPGILPGAPSAAPSPSPTCATCATPTPPPPTPSPTPALPSFVRPTPTPLPTFMSYVVQSGDNLGTIAHRFATTPRSLAWWNRGTYPSLDPQSAGYDPNHIQIGWTLTLIPGVVVDDNNPPTPSPAPPTLTPAATPAASGSPVAS